ncbi:MAG TPA: alpha/beta hydrolase, partial [Candidatus Dormibacteraeota bacterium]|nr:alpha/beta hydrolase [Candidatus Dormibacteraeota bacterium]
MRLLFLHGAGCTPAVFRKQRAAFPDAIALALPGHGAPGAAHSIEEFAQFVRTTIEREGYDDLVLCGSSMGGAIALELAIQGVPGVRALVTIGSGAKLRVSPTMIEGLRSGDPATLAALGDAMIATPHPQLREEILAELASISREQLLADFLACDAFDCRERLGAICLPALHLVGAKDVMTPPDRSTYLADRISGAHVEILPNLGHLAMLEGPEATNQSLSRFVSSL